MEITVKHFGVDEIGPFAMLSNGQRLRGIVGPAPAMLTRLESVSQQLNACMELMDEMVNAKTTPSWIKENCTTRLTCGEPELERAYAAIAQARKVL